METRVGGGTYWGVGARACDYCNGSAAAVLFCRADTAFLCGPCDARAHSANNLALRHERVLLCEVCEQLPASVTCKADAAALCASCDTDIHSANPLASRHHRVPVVPFFDSPDSNTPTGIDALPYTGDEDADECDGEAAAASWLLPEPSKDPSLEMGKSADCFFSEVDPYLDLEYTSSVDAGIYQADRVVPAAAGGPATFMLDFSISKPTYSGYTVSHSMSSSEAGVVPDGEGSMMADASTCGGGRYLLSSSATAVTVMDREARVMRYREKRKNRKFEKTIRYASRKAYAETRPRIKGRFAKRTETEAEVDLIYSSAVNSTATFMIADQGYGVVPSY